jgi:hypothetical protein
MTIFEPLVSRPKEMAVSERSAHFELTRQLFGERLAERRELPTGFAFRFDPQAFTDLARFVATEQKCSPFVDFEIALTRAPRELWLGMHGPEVTKDRFDAELGLRRSRGAPKTGAAVNLPASVS